LADCVGTFSDTFSRDRDVAVAVNAASGRSAEAGRDSICAAVCGDISNKQRAAFHINSFARHLRFLQRVYQRAGAMRSRTARGGIVRASRHRALRERVPAASAFGGRRYDAATCCWRGAASATRALQRRQHGSVAWRRKTASSMTLLRAYFLGIFSNEDMEGRRLQPGTSAGALWVGPAWRVRGRITSTVSGPFAAPAGASCALFCCWWGVCMVSVIRTAAVCLPRVRRCRRCMRACRSGCCWDIRLSPLALLCTVRGTHAHAWRRVFSCVAAGVR